MRLDEALHLRDRLLADMERTGTLVVTLYGGPGTGKSTTRALVFGELKQRGRNVEEAPEYAKELVWEKSSGKLGFQPYIIAKQMWRTRRLDGQVDAVITDTSTLLSLIYGGPENGVTPAFRNWVLDEYKSRNGLDFYLTRDPSRPYNPKGRTQQSLSEAEQADEQIKTLLDTNNIHYSEIQVDKDGNSHVTAIADAVEQVLDLSSNGEGLHVGTKTGRMSCSKPNLSTLDEAVSIFQ